MLVAVASMPSTAEIGNVDFAIELRNRNFEGFGLY